MCRHIRLDTTATYVIPNVPTAIGAQVTTYGVGHPLQPIYGTDPIAVQVFIRIRVKSKRG